MPELLSTENIKDAVTQIIGLHQHGANLLVKVVWRTKGRDALLPGDEQEWTGFVHKVLGGVLYLEFVEAPERYTEIPRDDLDYFKIVAKIRDNATMQSTPISPEAPRTTDGRQIAITNTKRPRINDDFVEAPSGEEKMQSFAVVGGVAGFKIPKHLLSHSVLYPEPYVLRLVSGGSAAGVTNEWKVELQEWLNVRDVNLFMSSSAGGKDRIGLREEIFRSNSCFMGSWYK